MVLEGKYTEVKNIMFIIQGGINQKWQGCTLSNHIHTTLIVI